MRKARIIQLTPNIAFGDAVSNDIFSMADSLTNLGYENLVVAITVADKVKNKAVPLKNYVAKPTDILLYHMSIGSDLTDFVINAKVSKKLLVYHNITPAEFFEFIPTLKKHCSQGRLQLASLVEHIEFAICDSDYNKEELDELGFKNTATLPIIFDKSDYINTKPSQTIINKYSDDGYTNILFVGRIAPNKKHEDVIASFHLYNKYINSKSRLFLVGTASAMEPYLYSLEDYIEKNFVQNVIFSGHVSFPEIIAYYKIADVFLCESEHEGFCVPLLEAMVFDVPIVAYSACAVPYTLEKSGVMFAQKDHRIVAELINILQSDEFFRSNIIDGQRKRLEFFDIEKVKDSFKEMILPWLSD